MKNLQEMLDLKLNCVRTIKNDSTFKTDVTKVPGGWIYTTYYNVGTTSGRGCSVHSVFVPEPTVNPEYNFIEPRLLEGK
jgi:hypothetical protein